MTLHVGEEATGNSGQKNAPKIEKNKRKIPLTDIGAFGGAKFAT